ncbi:hypothetical protein GS399_09945 [Pedobacter sp. HMF7647]|uniref:Arm DNA-binding domain-containing protein n=1 Tax=Hufsiella arboris TaxID=2695275 RepID=A0A7K1YB07_9SPHI|nr:Arm DNA-binding domain-containing protein [Hufsiella arboris]MXV51289.1 hypothetical protein [Hufsiella arboris]
MNTRFSLHFFLRKASYHNLGPLPIYLRITAGSKRSEVSIQRNCLPERWNTRASRMIGTKEDAREIMQVIETIRRLGRMSVLFKELYEVSFLAKS